MEISSLINNKFIIAIPVALALLGCMYKFNQFKSLNNKEDVDIESDTVEKTEYDIKYYAKLFVVCYLIGLLFVVLIKKCYHSYNGDIKSKLLDKLPFFGNNNNSDDTIHKEPLSQVLNKDINNNNNNNNNSFNKNDAIIKRESELKKDIEDLNVDVDTSNLEPIEISAPKTPPKYNEHVSSSDSNNTSNMTYKNDDTLIKKKQLLEKRKQLLALKNKQSNQYKLESFNTGTPDF